MLKEIGKALRFNHVSLTLKQPDKKAPLLA